MPTPRAVRWMVSTAVRRRSTSVTAVLLAALLCGAYYLFTPAYGAQLGQRSFDQSSNNISAQDLATLSFSLVDTNIIGSVEFQFCSNDPFPEDACTAPAGFDASGAFLTSQQGVTGFSIDTNNSNANTIILTRPPALANSGPASYTFNPIKNPSSPGSYYVRIQTFGSADGSGAASDYGGIAFAIVNQVSINAEVPPYLLFCTGITVSNFNCANAVGDYIDFGEFSSARASSATSQMLVATNAQQGYAISIDGTTLASGNNIIAALSTGDVSRPGTAQFGFNLKSNTTPRGGSEAAGPGTSQASPNYAQPDIYRFNPSDTVVANPKSDDIRVYTSNYIVNVPKVQSPGIYVSTVTYVCLANF
jgi:hypothetical protein